MPARIAIFGGTFDPVHLGHLILAERCREECRLDQVWFIPAGAPPHKASDSITPGERRAEMLEFAIAGHPQFSVNRMELARQGRSFTVDTLRQLHSEDATRELFFLIGADSLADLPLWRDPAGIADRFRVDVLVAARHPINRVDVHATFMSKRGLADPRLSRVVPHVGDLIDELG